MSSQGSDGADQPKQALTTGSSPSLPTPTASPPMPSTSDPAYQPPQVDPAFIGKILLEIQAKLTTEFLGPFPSPETLARLEKIVPGSAGQIIAMAMTQSAHRQHLEKTVVEGDMKKSWYGLWSGFAIGVIGIIGTVLLGIFDHPVLGGILGGGTLVSLVSVFVIGTSRRQAEREGKVQAIAKDIKERSTKPNQKPT